MLTKSALVLVSVIFTILVVGCAREIGDNSLEAKTCPLPTGNWTDLCTKVSLDLIDDSWTHTCSFMVKCENVEPGAFLDIPVSFPINAQVCYNINKTTKNLELCGGIIDPLKGIFGK